MPAPPLKAEISDTYPNPSNAVARTGFGKLWEYVTGLLGLTGNTAEAHVALGTQAFVQSVLGTILTALGFAFVANSYIKFPSVLGGWIVQWGAATTTATGVTVTYPIAFPSAVTRVFLTPQSASGVFATHLVQNNTQVYVQAWSNSSTQTAALIEWLAIGR